MSSVVCLVLLSLVACSTVRGDWCEPNTRHNCSCTVTLTRTTVDCSDQNIDSCSIDIPTNVTDLIIANNQIPQINSTCFSMFRTITTLDMSNNRIGSIDKSSFIQCENLVELDLSGNYLNYSLINNADTFIGLGKLQRLYIDTQFRLPPFAHDIYPDKALGELVNLQELRIDGVPDGRFESGFRRLVNLKSVTLATVTGTSYSHCSIQSLTNTTFVNIMSVEFLNMSTCNISAIEIGTFVPLTNLKTLDLSNNRDLKFKSVPYITYGLQFSKIEKLYLNYIHQTFGIGTVVRNYDIRFMKNTTLRELYIDDNRIQLLENCVIRHLPQSLQLLSANGNKFTFGHYLCELADFVSLKIFSLNRQHVNRNLHIVDIVDFECEQEHTSNVNAVLDVNENRTTGLDECMSCTDNFCATTNFCLPSKLEELYMSDSVLMYVILKTQFNENNSIKKVDVSGNRLYKWTGPMMNVEVEYVDLSNNLCEVIDKGFFRNQNKMKTLLLDGNLLGLHIEHHTDGQLFNDLRSLSELRFSQNRLQTLPAKLFTGLVQLETLNLRFNLIEKFDVEVAHMKHLTKLDLSHNQLSTIPDQNRKVLLEISRTSPLTIDLTGNILRCTCSNLELLEWMARPTFNFTGVEKYRCSDDNGKITILGNLHDKISDMKKECATYTVLIIVTSIGITTALTVIMAAVLNRYKWKLRYIFYKNWNRHRGYEEINETERENYRYDAFISYAEGDVRFVRYRLLENLENNFHLKLCVHDRDFLAGNAVAANIVDAISTSYKTVVVMSERFLQSHWCMYELNMARMESLHSREGRSVVFIVMLEAVDTSRLPLEVMDLVQNQSYLEYPNDPDQGDVVFWGRLRDAIFR